MQQFIYINKNKLCFTEYSIKCCIYLQLQEIKFCVHALLTSYELYHIQLLLLIIYLRTLKNTNECFMFACTFLTYTQV